MRYVFRPLEVWIAPDHENIEFYDLIGRTPMVESWRKYFNKQFYMILYTLIYR